VLTGTSSLNPTSSSINNTTLHNVKPCRDSSIKMPNAQKITSNSVSRGWIGYLAGGFFIGMSIWAVFEMRLSKASASVDLPMKMTTNTLQFPYGQQRLRNVYTGFGPLDYGLSFLVTAFLPAVAGWDKGLQIQQIYFLFSVFPIFSFFSVESVRKSNIGSIVSLYVSNWAVS
jgi:hypothetical protein